MPDDETRFVGDRFQARKGREIFRERRVRGNQKTACSKGQKDTERHVIEYHFIRLESN
jgi:hypothetical protein